jgi:hypothetical protein
MGDGGATGLIKLRDCCLFTWTRPGDRELRVIVIRDHHCSACVAELEAMTDARVVRLIDRRSARRATTGE